MSDKARVTERLVVGASPRADLLPPELKAESKLRAQRRALIGVAILTVLLVAAVYLYTSIASAAASLKLEASTAQTESLLEQQQAFVEVRELKTQLATIESAQLIGVSTEIDWQDYFNKVQGSLPVGTVVQSVTAATSAPGSAEVAGATPLQPAQVATITFSATTATLPSVSSWIDNLALLPGFADATATAITLNATDGIYTVNMTMHVNYEALANRFGADKEDSE